MNSKSTYCPIPDCEKCTVRHQTPFGALAGNDLASISAAKGGRSYRRGEIIYYADDHPTGIHCIHEGVVKIYKLGRDGREHIVRLAGSGAIMGYRAFLGGDSYGVYAEPVTPARICHIPGPSLLPFLSSHYGFATRVLELMANDLKAAEAKMVEMAQHSVRERLAEALLMLKRTCGLNADQTTISLDLTRGELASVVGAALETVSRQLSQFKQEGLIDLRGHKIRILDDRALLEITNLYD